MEGESQLLYAGAGAVAMRQATNWASRLWEITGISTILPKAMLGLPVVGLWRARRRREQGWNTRRSSTNG